MKVLCLLYADETARTNDPAVLAAYGAFYDKVTGAGQFVAGDPVQPSNAATTITVREGSTSVAAGPAHPGDEQIIGFYVLDVADHAEADGLAALIPAASHGRVEVRPILVM